MQGDNSVAGESTLPVNGTESSSVCRPASPRVRSPFPLACRDARSEPTVVQARTLRVGDGHLGIIAGPCSVESREQILEIARLVQDAGATALRGGAFKPRTSPYSFQGLKEKGLELLAEARQRTGLAIVTEVMSPESVELVATYADVLQIGARNMQNYPLLEAVGAVRVPVLLKRGPSATLEEWLLAAEYILKGGNGRVILCERGIRTFEDHTRYTLPLASVPALREATHLPVVVDPSHGTGRATLVPAMARAAIAAGADGLLIEVHPHPDDALSDGDQSLTPAQFRRLVADCHRIAEVLGRTL
jgi:3-deoxy-7-phosphoheptulonate synthase